MRERSAAFSFQYLIICGKFSLIKEMLGEKVCVGKTPVPVKWWRKEWICHSSQEKKKEKAGGSE